MKIATEERQIRIVVVIPEGRVDAFSAPDLRRRIDELLADGVIHYVCDLSAVDFLDSAGMAVLVSVLKRARQAGGNVKLVKPSAATAQRILHLTKFDRVFDIADTADLAVARFLN
jgi:anti-anti-sigma factor